MKIISKYKDFYDYLQYVYGQDNNVTWERDKELDTDYITCCFSADFGYYNLYEIDFVSVLGDVYPVYLNSVVNEDILQTFDRYICTYTHGSSFFEWLKEFKKLNTQNILEMHRKLNAPIFKFYKLDNQRNTAAIYNEVPVLIKYSGLVSALGDPDVLYKKIYNFFIANKQSADKTPPVQLNNRLKIEKAGFDYKYSFRKRKKHDN